MVADPSTPKAKRKPRRKAKASPKPARDPMRMQAMIAEIVVLIAAPAYGVSIELASTVARRVVRDHPSALVPELVPVILGHLERAMLAAA